MEALTVNKDDYTVFATVLTKLQSPLAELGCGLLNILTFKTAALLQCAQLSSRLWKLIEIACSTKVVEQVHSSLEMSLLLIYGCTL